MSQEGQKDEVPEVQSHVVQPQKQVEGYTVRISSKSHLKGLLDAVKHPNKPILMYDEFWCNYHDGWHCGLRRPDSQPLKCYENELLLRDQIKKPEPGMKHFEF